MKTQDPNSNLEICESALGIASTIMPAIRIGIILGAVIEVLNLIFSFPLS